MKKPVVYIASPYTRGDVAINTHSQCRAFDELLSDGIVWPIAPLWSHFQHTLFPRQYQDWINYDLALLDRYDACLRLNATDQRCNYEVTQSSGADGEVAAFTKLGKPVFYSKEDLYDWVGRKGGQQIIGLCGYAGSGKDEAAKALTKHGWIRVSFADPLRQALMNLNPLVFLPNGGPAIPLSEAVFEYGWDSAKKWSQVRKYLQRLGTEAGRDIHGEDCWLNIAKRKIDGLASSVVITDVRFPNEVKLIRELGGRIFRIQRSGVAPANGHVSEKLDFTADETIYNDSTPEVLHQNILLLAGFALLSRE